MKRFSLLAIMMAFVMLLASCGGGDADSDTSGGDADTDVQVEETTAAPDAADDSTDADAADVQEVDLTQVDLYGSDPEVTADMLEGKKIAYLAPSKDILYWQWVEDGIEQVCEELGVELVTLDAQNSASTQQSNTETALSSDVDGIILSPVSSTSSTNVLLSAEDAGIPITFAAIGPDEGVTNYDCCVTADDYTSGYENGIFLCDRIEELGGGTIGVLSLPLDRTNAKAKMAGLEKACEEKGGEIAQGLQTTDLTVNLAAQQANDLITTNSDMKGIYGMYEQAGIGAVNAVESSNLLGEVSIVSSDGSPESIRFIREGKIDGMVVQPAVGQGVVAARQLFRVMCGLDVFAKDIPLPEPLVTTENVDDADIQELLPMVYPASAGSY